MERREGDDAAAAAVAVAERDLGSGIGVSPPTNIEVNVADVEPGLRLLQAICRRAPSDIRSVTLIDSEGAAAFPSNDEGERTEAESRSLRLGFGRFVAMLASYGRDEGIREVSFNQIRFDNEEPGVGDFDEADEARLFGDVLPTLPLLERVCFNNCILPIKGLRLFASKLSSSPSAVSSSLVELHIEECFGEFSLCVPAIAALIRRNIPIRELTLRPAAMMDRNSCREIFSSLQQNTNLRSLDVRVLEVYHDALVLPHHPTSALRRLFIEVDRWTPKGKASLARQLKTNTKLEELWIEYERPGASLSHRPWIEPLSAHNFSLCFLSEKSQLEPVLEGVGTSDERVAACLRRNGRIQQALAHRQGCYRVSPAVLLPRTLEMASGVPTLLYRFVRRGDVNALAEVLVLVAEQHSRTGRSNKTRGRRPPPPPRGRPPS